MFRAVIHSSDYTAIFGIGFIVTGIISLEKFIVHGCDCKVGYFWLHPMQCYKIQRKTQIKIEQKQGLCLKYFAPKLSVLQLLYALLLTLAQPLSIVQHEGLKMNIITGGETCFMLYDILIRLQNLSDNRRLDCCVVPSCWCCC